MTDYKTDYDDLMIELVDALKCPISWLLIKAQTIQESGLDPNAVSSSGAEGLMQLMPETALEYGCTDRKDPRQNLTASIRYMTHLYGEFDNEKPSERIKFAWGAYNAGEGHILQAQAECHKFGLKSDQWSSISAMLPRITGDNSKQTINYVKSIQNILLDLLIQETK